MPVTTPFILLKQNEQPALTIRARTGIQGLPGLIGQSYARLAAYIGELGETVSGVPFVCYYNLDMQDLDVEIGFPVSGRLPESGDIKPSSIPAGFSVFCMYRGHYSDMAPAYGDMGKWIEENGFAPAGPAYEFYYNGPDCAPDELLTKIVLPVIRK